MFLGFFLCDLLGLNIPVHPELKIPNPESRRLSFDVGVFFKTLRSYFDLKFACYLFNGKAPSVDPFYRPFLFFNEKALAPPERRTTSVLRVAGVLLCVFFLCSYEKN